MPSELTAYIVKYGYLAIFSLVFLQELGIPNPVTNEFVLLFSGYLAFMGTLSLWWVFLAAVSADFIGTTILYTIFYFFGGYILQHQPRWFPLKAKHIDALAEKISEREQWGIYVGRLIPFLRGYASVAAGILHIKPKTFMPAVVISAITWSGGYVIAGKLLGKYWQNVAAKIGGIETLVLIAALIVIITLIGRAVMRNKEISS